MKQLCSVLFISGTWTRDGKKIFLVACVFFTFTCPCKISRSRLNCMILTKIFYHQKNKKFDINATEIVTFPKYLRKKVFSKLQFIVFAIPGGLIWKFSEHAKRTSSVFSWSLMTQREGSSTLSCALRRSPKLFVRNDLALLLCAPEDILSFWVKIIRTIYLYKRSPGLTWHAIHTMHPKLSFNKNSLR